MTTKANAASSAGTTAQETATTAKASEASAETGTANADESSTKNKAKKPEGLLASVGRWLFTDLDGN